MKELFPHSAKTGDIVVEEPTAIYRYVGRRDRMVKKRGYRVIYAKPEFAIAFDPKVWEEVASRRVLMSPTEYWTINYALVAVLKNKHTGERGKFVTVHPPAHVDARQAGRALKQRVG